ncbi:MAG TPA: hypothetical protein VFP78_08955 [Solirubrobacteraceae bacterium]|nr:hypothetical protein [Solirubrobacteraceae bacterium]
MLGVLATTSITAAFACVQPRDDGGRASALRESGPGDIATGRNYIFTGNVKLVFSANGSVIAFESSGRMEDVCAMIA